MLIEGVQTQLQTSYELYPGTYVWDLSIVDRGGLDAPFGGKYQYKDNYTGTAPAVGDKIGSGVYKVTGDLTCSATSISYIKLTRASDGNYTYHICLTTDDGSTYLEGDRAEVDDSKNTSIFHGVAATDATG